MTIHTRSYRDIHALVFDLRGPASDYDCLCGKPATEWAYQHTGDPELRDVNGLNPHSADPDDYEPMCGSCHKKLDFAQNPERLAAFTDQARQAIVTASGVRKQMLAEDPAFVERTREAASIGGQALAERVRTDPTLAKKMQDVGSARAGEMWADPEFQALMRETGRKSMRLRRRCAECSLESSPPGIGRHQKYSGHRGYRSLTEGDHEQGD